MKGDVCTTCLRRGAQLQTALPVNMAVALLFRATMKFHVVLFSGGNDHAMELSDMTCWLQDELRDALGMGRMINDER